jgi:hypothetical protein
MLKIKYHLLVLFAAVILISFGGCKNRTAKNAVTLYAEEFFNDSLPDELQNFASIELISQDDSTERISLFFKDPQKINQAYPPLLKFSDEKAEHICFNQAINMIGNDLGIAFSDTVGNERAILRMRENVPTGFLLVENGQDQFYSVANYSTFKIFEDEDDEDDEFFDKVLIKLGERSSRVDKIPQSITNVVPSNCKLYFCAIGDLNRDKYDDAILISADKHQECWILTGTSDHSFKINIIKDIDTLLWGVSVYFNDARAFEEPFFDIVIKNGYFSIEQYGGVSGNNKSIHLTHFKYLKEENNWVLFRSDFVPNRFLSGNCCYDFHTTKHYMEKIYFEEYGAEE